MTSYPRVGPDFPVHLRPNVVEPDECDRLVKFVDEELGDEPTDGIAAIKFEEIMVRRSPRHAEIKRAMNAFRYTAIHQIRGHFDGIRRAHPSTTLLTRWHEGQGLAPHTDTDTWWRTHTAICYLNDDFAGGELEFVHLGVVVRPEPGLFVAFPSDDRRTQHQVSPVTSGRRYTLSMFQTDQLERVEL